MDISDFEVIIDGLPIPLRHPKTDEVLTNDKGEVMALVLLGTDSDVYRDRQKAIVDRRIAQGTNAPKQSAEAMELQGIETLCMCVVGFENLQIGGKPYPYTRENVRKLLTDPRLPWIFDQVNQSVADRRRFLKGSAKS